MAQDMVWKNKITPNILCFLLTFILANDMIFTDTSVRKLRNKMTRMSCEMTEITEGFS